MHDSGASRRGVVKSRLEFRARMEMRAPDAAQRAALAAWCAADPGSILHCAPSWVPALRSSVKNAAPRPGHEVVSNVGCLKIESGMTLGSQSTRSAGTALCDNLLPQQHRIRAVHGLGAVDHGAFQRARLHGNIFGEEPRQRDIALWIAGALAEVAGGQRFTGEHAAAKRRSEQPEIG